MTVLWDFAGRGSRGCTASRGASSFAKSRVNFASLIDIYWSYCQSHCLWTSSISHHLDFSSPNWWVALVALHAFSPELSIFEDILWTAVAAQTGASVDIGVRSLGASELRFLPTRRSRWISTLSVAWRTAYPSPEPWGEAETSFSLHGNT